MVQPKQSPTWFGRYILLERIATGGMGEVHLAKLVGSHGYEKLVVIKRLHNSRQFNDKYTAMFFHEAKLAAQLNHSRIVQVFDAGEIEQIPYMAMEYVAGKSLRKLLDTLNKRYMRLSFHHIVDIFSQICDGLAFAHQAEHFSGAPLGIIHRDINPHNLLLSYFGEIKIIDFGIAKSELKEEQTVAGTIKGTVSYMSPEQSLGQKLDKRSDIYSLGICLYEALTGNNPFQKESLEASLLAIQQSIVPPLALMRSDAMLFQPILDNMLAVDPNQRFQRADQCAAMLRSLPLPRSNNNQSLAQLMQGLFEQALQHEATRLEVVGPPAQAAVEETELTAHASPPTPLESQQSITPTKLVPIAGVAQRQPHLEVTRDLKAPAPVAAAIAMPVHETQPISFEPEQEQGKSQTTVHLLEPLPLDAHMHPSARDTSLSQPAPAQHRTTHWPRLLEHQWHKWRTHYPYYSTIFLMVVGMLLGYSLQMVLSQQRKAPKAAAPSTESVSLSKQRDIALILEDKPEDKPEDAPASANEKANENRNENELEGKVTAAGEESIPRKTNRLLRNLQEGRGLFQLLLESNQEIMLTLDGRLLNSSLVRSNKPTGKIAIKDRRDPNCGVQLYFTNSTPLKLQLLVNGLQIFDVRDSAGQKIGTIGTTPYEIVYHKRPINLGLVLVERGGTCQLRLFFREPER